MEIVRGAEDAAHEAGASVVISVLHTHAGPGRDWLERLAARRTDGVVIVASKLSSMVQAQLTARSLPFVVVDPEGEPAPGVASVGATNWHGGLAATRHLLELGHRRIGMISGPADMLCSQARIDGYRAALETAGIEAAPELIRRGTFLVDSGHDHGHALLSLGDPPTAIFAGSDLQAFGVFEAARQRGMRVPEDLSVVGFDDLPLSRSAWPPLTTVRQPLQEMAALAARTVLGMSRGGPGDPAGGARHRAHRPGEHRPAPAVIPSPATPSPDSPAFLSDPSLGRFPFHKTDISPLKTKYLLGVP
nr:hypothetical protein GCM10020093_042460 [Planobispora longispora]